MAFHSKALGMMEALFNELETGLAAQRALDAVNMLDGIQAKLDAKELGALKSGAPASGGLPPKNVKPGFTRQKSSQEWLKGDYFSKLDIRVAHVHHVEPYYGPNAKLYHKIEVNLGHSKCSPDEPELGPVFVDPRTILASDLIPVEKIRGFLLLVKNIDTKRHFGIISEGNLFYAKGPDGEIDVVRMRPENTHAAERITLADHDIYDFRAAYGGVVDQLWTKIRPKLRSDAEGKIKYVDGYFNKFLVNHDGQAAFTAIPNAKIYLDQIEVAMKATNGPRPQKPQKQQK